MTSIYFLTGYWSLLQKSLIHLPLSNGNLPSVGGSRLILMVRVKERAKAGASFVARNSDAPVIVAATALVHDYGFNNIELLATWYAISWAYNKFGVTTLWFEGDSLHVIQQLNQASNPSDDPILVDCKIILSKLLAFRISHIFKRE